MFRWLMIYAAVAAFGPPVRADVVGAPAVVNGDTLRFDKEHVKLFGIDAPESAQTCVRQGLAWPCGQAAQDHLWELVAGEYLSCVEREQDQNGMTISLCTLADGRDLGELMVESGLARADRAAAGSIYDAAEHAAQQAKRGLWAGDSAASVP